MKKKIIQKVTVNITKYEETIACIYRLWKKNRKKIDNTSIRAHLTIAFFSVIKV